MKWPRKRSAHFEPIRLIAAGGMGDVFLARMKDTDEERLVALKRPHRHLARQRRWAKLFESEAFIGSLLIHENIVATLQAGKDQDGPYLALEYVEGHSLRQLLLAAKSAQTPFPVDAFCSLARQVARGLAYAHALRRPELGSEGLIHRDISPDNVLISKEGRAKLTDFGLAKLQSAVNTNTQTGSVRGKFGYLAPEIYEGSSARATSDLFSLAAMLYECASGLRPFEGKTEGEIVRATLFATPVPLASLRPEIPERISAWIGKALSRTPTDRPLDAQSLVDAIETGESGSLAAFMEQLESQHAFRAFTTPHTHAAPGHVPEHKWNVIPWLLGAAGFAALLGVVLTREPAQAPPPPPPPKVSTTEPIAPAAPPPEPAPAPPKPPAKIVKRRTEYGQLWIRTQPWAEVLIDGEYKGMTPMPALRLPAGAHRIVLVNKELNLSRTMDVTLKKEESRTLKVDLQAPQ